MGMGMGATVSTPVIWEDVEQAVDRGGDPSSLVFR
jgi:hypothetical protein